MCHQAILKNADIRANREGGSRGVEMGILNNRLQIVMYAMGFLVSFSFFGTLFLFQPYLINFLNFNQKEALLIWSGYAGTVYLCELLGGWLGGKHLDYAKCVLIGSFLFAMGFVIIAFHPSLFIYGLALASCGQGLITTNIRVIVGSQASLAGMSSHKRFVFLQGATVVAQLLGLTVLDTWSKQNLNDMFAGAAISATLCFVVAAFNYSFIRNILSTNDQFDNIKYNFKSHIMSGFMVILLFALCFSAIKYNALSIILLCASIFVVVKLVQYYRGFGDDKEAKVKLIALLLLTLGFFIFAVYAKMCMSTIMVFADQHVNGYLFGYLLSSKSFSAFDSLTYLFLLSIFIGYVRRKNREKQALNARLYFGISLITVALALLLLWAVTINTDIQKIHAGHFVLYTIISGLSGFFMLPTCMAVINILVNFGMRGFIMGAWVFILAFSADVNRSFTELVLGDVKVFTMDDYNTLFGITAFVVVVATIVLIPIWAWWWRKHKDILYGKV